MLTIPMDLEVDAQQRSDIKEELHDNGVLQVRMLYMTEWRAQIMIKFIICAICRNDDDELTIVCK